VRPLDTVSKSGQLPTAPATGRVLFGRVTVSFGLASREEPMTQSARKPQAYAMLPCQRVITQEETGLISLLSIFEAVMADQLPLTIVAL